MGSRTTQRRADMGTRSLVAAMVIAVLSGCASTHTPPPEPDMSRLVNVNRDVPPELYETYDAGDADKEKE
ncbi:MAG: hypothetical protein ACQEXI_16465 [Pseudomonadota bacterium]